MTIFDFFYDERRYGWVVDTRYQWINMLLKMKDKNPKRFNEFQYSMTTFYHHLDRVQMEQTYE